jgi:hypothetical protein
MYSYLLPGGTGGSSKTDSSAWDAKAVLLSTESLDALAKSLMRLVFAALTLRPRHVISAEPTREADTMPSIPPALQT